MDPFSNSNFSFNQLPYVQNQYTEDPSSINFGFMNHNPFLLPPYHPIIPQNPSSSMPTVTNTTTTTTTTDEDSPLDDEAEFSATMLRYINQMLMEEDMEEKPCMFHDSLALQAAEKSLYEVIGETYPSSSVRNYHNLDSPGDSFSSNFSGYSSFGTASTSNSVDPTYLSHVDLGDYTASIPQTSFDRDFVFKASSISTNRLSMNNNGFLGSSRDCFLDSKLFSKSESVLQFERGVEEASKFLPKANPLVIDLENNIFTPSLQNGPKQAVIKMERDEREHLSAESRGRKNHEREDESDLGDGRSSKQSAVYRDESEELSELFDKVLLGRVCGNNGTPLCILNEDHNNNGPETSIQKNEEPNRSGSGKNRTKKQGNKKGVVDLRTLLVMCAQAASSDDRVTANDLLKQIRQHSSLQGDGSQRLAHCFANALQARLAGTGTQIYTALSSKRTSAADVVKAYQMYISACPFKKLSLIFANHTILSLARPKEVETLHIVDFGIRYGFQWPALIVRLSKRPGGPPKLRMTGIELPQPGFRPAQSVEETGRRLAKYCDRFNVPFEFNAIAQKWETIKIEDLKIKENELLVVNCMVRFKNLLDETVVLNSPRDAVLNLIRKANPSIFIHTTVNGSYSVPFFVTRFREALFHYSTLFDVLDTNTAREDPMRLMFEKEFFGREVMNIIACEGTERVERPATYKQWQVRNMRAGFRQLPLDHHLINKLRCKMKDVYHSDFMLVEDGNCMLQGWKGRIIYASSCWVPA
ncbi:PREDICTED: scarecrow-like protein 14 [Lupinus angustifolius]|nr:PREDICTED: scarecrow-like protein 14 [Lupinus angustifolius]